MMYPVFALVIAVAWLPIHFLISRRLASDSLTPEYRQNLQKYVTRWSAILVPAVATVLILTGALFALGNEQEAWWIWLIAGLVFLVDLVLAARLRKRTSGRWLGGGPDEAGKRALATRLGALAALSYVGCYITIWVTGPTPATWATVLSGILMLAFIVFMVAIGFLLIFAEQDDANEEWRQRHGSS